MFLTGVCLSADTITVAIPDFANNTADHVTRISPGKYKEKNVKTGEDKRIERFEESGKAVKTESSRNAYKKKLERFVEYAPGDWALPDKAGVLAADTLASRFLNDNLKVLSRNSQTFETREEERLFATVTSPPNELIDLYRDLNADYLLIGRIGSFRIDETEGRAYGVDIKRVDTRISGDIQVVDVATGEIAAQKQFVETITRNLQHNLNTSVVYDWEMPLRVAIERVAPSIIKQLLASNSPEKIITDEIAVEINSTPSGADILVGDLFVGNTPATISLEKGRSDLRIEKQGFQPWSRKVKVSDNLEINVTLKETPGPPKKDENRN